MFTSRRLAVAAALLQFPLAAVAVHSAAAASSVGATGQVVGYGGLCLDDRSASTANFNPVQVYTCNG
ncbi:chitosanase, partial [Streptacidiphilus jiangxiensis]